MADTSPATSSPASGTSPAVIVFDVNETLSDLSALGARFVDVGASASAAPLWFASVLRDGFALTAAGENPSFATVARQLLLVQLSGSQLKGSVEAAAEHVMEGFTALEVHPDVTSGVDQLHEAGHRLVTLSNGSASVAERLLTTAGIRDRFERLLSVEDAERWKPAPESYAYAASVCGTDPADMMLVACHPWDVDGARRAGFRAAWVNRTGGPYPGTFLEPTYTVGGIDELADRLEEAGRKPM
ncbi:MAG: haloacid dehalogenase type II [Nocardioidaceae bacterium]